MKTSILSPDDLYTFKFEGEDIVLGWRMGKFFVEGYDFESEKTLLALRGGYGEGVNVLVVALSEYITRRRNLARVIFNFEDELKVLKKSLGNFGRPRLGQEGLAYTYVTFSSNLFLRRAALRKGKFSKLTWRRIEAICRQERIQSKTLNESIKMSSLAREKREEYLAARQVSVAVAGNANLPPSLFGAFVLDIRLDVLIALARNPSLPKEYMHAFDKDKQEVVRSVLLQRSDLPDELGLKYARQGTKWEKRSLAMFSHSKKVLSILKSDNGDGIQPALRSNLFALREGIVTLPKQEMLALGLREKLFHSL